jgi:diadenosine tetraphosphate (Ap4A) HIT family hydrolase
MTCPFCQRIAANPSSIASTDLVVAFPDAYPLNPGHTLIVPRRHVGRISDLHDDERLAIWDLVPIVKAWIDAAYDPQGYNIGINDGPAAGQTIAHVHLHVIPRYAGDTPDPRGGVRWVIAERAPYWKKDDE